jgi:hypothetical protein
MSGGLRGETISQGGVETGTETRFDEAGNPKRVRRCPRESGYLGR